MFATLRLKISLLGDFSKLNRLLLLLILITLTPIYVEETWASFLLPGSLPLGIGQLMVLGVGGLGVGGGSNPLLLSLNSSTPSLRLIHLRSLQSPPLPHVPLRSTICPTQSLFIASFYPSFMLFHRFSIPSFIPLGLHSSIKLLHHPLSFFPSIPSIFISA